MTCFELWRNEIPVCLCILIRLLAVVEYFNHEIQILVTLCHLLKDRSFIANKIGIPFNAHTIVVGAATYCCLKLKHPSNIRNWVNVVKEKNIYFLVFVLFQFLLKF